MERSRLARTALLLLALSLPAAAANAGDTVTEEAGTGLELRSDPSGAEVFVDGVRRGKTPLVVSDLPAGQHFLRLEKDGYWTRESTVTIAKDRRIRVGLELVPAKGRLEVQVYRDGDAASPIPGAAAETGGVRIEGAAVDLAEGAHTVTVRAFGFITERVAVSVARGETTVLRVGLRRAPFAVERVAVSRRAFNPGNPGSLGETVVSVILSAPGSATLAVADSSGAVVRELDLPADGRNRSVAWNGADAGGRSLPDGTYRIVVSALSEAGEPVSAETAATIDSNLRIEPAAASLDAGGLFFCPTPAGLARGSFELGAAFLAGRPRGAEEAFGPPPFSFALRAAPAERWEFVANLRAESGGEGLRPAAAFSGKRTLFGSAAGSAFAGAAVARYGWAERAETSAFAAAPGIELALPLSAALRAGSARGRGPRIEFVVAPSALWAGDAGVPDRALPAPTVSAGAALRWETFSAALSFRAESEYRDAELARGPLSFAAETRWSPGSAVVSYSLVGGAWTAGGERGAFAGAALGFIY